MAVGAPVRVRLYVLVAFCKSGDESEVWVPFCVAEVPLPAEPEDVKLMETVPVADGKV